MPDGRAPFRGCEVPPLFSGFIFNSKYDRLLYYCCEYLKQGIVPVAAQTDQWWMQRALEEAARAAACNEVPVGAVIVEQDRLIACGHNSSISLCDPTAHAEIIALRRAGAEKGNYRLPGTVVYVTVEPCIMCMGALVHARIARLVYGAPDAKAGAAGSAFDTSLYRGLNHRFPVTSGIMEDECRLILQQFFQGRRLQRRDDRAG